ncbi:MAG TPA: hypothetical protein PK395_17460, partial [bacterium]|nr:hypothetical protein [bacterium]
IFQIGHEAAIHRRCVSFKNTNQADLPTEEISQKGRVCQMGIPICRARVYAPDIRIRTNLLES